MQYLVSGIASNNFETNNHTQVTICMSQVVIYFQLAAVAIFIV